MITSSLAGKSYFTVAVLPTTASSTDSQRTDLANSYGTYAYAHVTGTKVDYSYDPGQRHGATTYSFTTTAREGTQRNTVISLYPHQWKALAGGTPISQTYVSPRGPMKILVGVPGFTHGDEVPRRAARAAGGRHRQRRRPGHLDQLR